MAKAKDWTKIYKKYKGQWVALASNEETVVGSGKTLKEALASAHKKGYADPIMARMPSNLLPLVATPFFTTCESVINSKSEAVRSASQTR